jgi:hypothetical protein
MVVGRSRRCRVALAGECIRIGGRSGDAEYRGTWSICVRGNSVRWHVPFGHLIVTGISARFAPVGHLLAVKMDLAVEAGRVSRLRVGGVKSDHVYILSDTKMQVSQTIDSVETPPTRVIVKEWVNGPAAVTGEATRETTRESSTEGVVREATRGGKRGGNAGDQRRRPTQETNTGDQHRRPTQETNTGEQHRRPTQKSSTAEQHRRPTQQSNTEDQHRRPTQKTNTAEQHRRPTQKSSTEEQHRRAAQETNTEEQHREKTSHPTVEAGSADDQCWAHASSRTDRGDRRMHGFSKISQPSE